MFAKVRGLPKHSLPSDTGLESVFTSNTVICPERGLHMGPNNLCYTSHVTFYFFPMSACHFLQDLDVTFYSFYKRPRRISTTFKVAVSRFVFYPCRALERLPHSKGLSCINMAISEGKVWLCVCTCISKGYCFEDKVVELCNILMYPPPPECFVFYNKHIINCMPCQFYIQKYIVVYWLLLHGVRISA